MSLTRPPLWASHDERDATFTDFGGWEMPVEFASIREEHAAVREDVGIFDVSHMGEVRVSGPDAKTLMQRLTSNDVDRLGPGDSQYATITTEEGVILDDTVVYRLPDEEGPVYLFVPNAGNDGTTVERWSEHRDEWGLDATVENRTEEYGMVAIQGPKALTTVEAETDAVGAPTLTGDAGASSVGDLSRFTASYASVAGVECWVARTGYTGEDGVELLFPGSEAEAIWDAFVPDCQPCGLGARDTLRLEAGYLLAGQDFHHETNPRTPYEANIPFTVALETEFVGRDALEASRADGPSDRLVGFELLDRGVPRAGYDLANEDGDVIGGVTSGTMSPTLEKPIGLGYVPDEYGDPGTALTVIVRGREKRARVEATPFVDTV